MSAQLYCEDSISNTILNLLIITDQLILPLANVGSDGRVVAANPKTTDILTDISRISKTLKANKIRICATFDTPFLKTAANLMLNFSMIILY